MQNIPGIALEEVSEQFKTVKFSQVKNTEKQQLFANLFDQHSTKIESELALTPVSTNDKMLDATPQTVLDAEEQVSAANTPKEPVINDKEEVAVEEERDQDELMTQEDFDELKDDLEEYGLSEEEIAEIEEEINSEEGMTWGEFVAVLSDKMSGMRQVSLTDGQKEQLSTFFAKFGFTTEESNKLIAKMENGEQADVMAALKEKLDAMPKGKQLLLTKDEVEAFSSAMNFSKEFTAKIQETLGKNVLPKDAKEAFTMISQEMADMDKKDQELVRAVGKTFVKSMGEHAKESTAAKQINEAVDLKPRVAEELIKGETKAEIKEQVKEDFKEAVDTRKDSLTADNARKNVDQSALPKKAEVDVDLSNQEQAPEQDNHWNNFFAKLQGNNTSQTPTSQFQAKTETIESMLKTGLAEVNTKTDTKTWEKVSAPKVMRQVENAVIQNMNNGGKQLTLQLTPEHLGKLSVMLQVNGKEVSATIRAENADAAKLIAENIDIIKNSLESQGLKVDKLDVQAGLSDDMNRNDWFGQNEHNLARDREAMVAMRKHMQQMRDGNGDLAQDLQSTPQQANVADQGLHIIA